MRRFLSIALALALLLGFGTVAWTAAGLPPVPMVWRHGFSGRPEPTGEVLAIGGLEFVEIGPGCFKMGSRRFSQGGDFLGRWCAQFGLPWGDRPKPSDEMPVHWVEFPRGFWIAKTEVTNAQYEAFDPQHERSASSPGDDDPVVEVSWEEARKYCAWLGERSGRAIRLPSESEWECACRAGSEGEYCFGDDAKLRGEYMWWRANSDGRAHAVGTRRANAWDLHDFHGNVWEWCEDTWHGSYEGAPEDGTARTGGDRTDRVGRGGGWDYPAGCCRSAFRFWFHPAYRARYLGFRPAFSPSAP